MKKKGEKLFFISRKIEETGNNAYGQHILINSTTAHEYEKVNDEWELLANFEDSIKLTNRGKSIKVGSA